MTKKALAAVLVKAVQYVGVLRGAVGKIESANIRKLWGLVLDVIEGMEKVAATTKGMTGPEKKGLAKKLIMERVQAPWYKKLLLNYVIGYVVDIAVDRMNGLYGKLWGTGEAEAGYAEPLEEEAPIAALSVQSETPKILKSVDGVNAESVLEALKWHNIQNRDQPLNVLAAMAQTALETGNFKHFRGFNLAGIKSTAGWEKVGGKVWSAGTSEFQGGAMVKTTARFRAYDDLAHFLSDYAGLIYRCYPLVVKNVDCVWLALAGFYKGKYGAWATDPKYYEKLCVMAVRYAPQVIGEGWEERLNSAYQYARQRGFPQAWMEKAVVKALGG